MVGSVVEANPIIANQESSRHDVAMRSQCQSTGPVGIGQAERFPSQAPHEVILDKCQDYQDPSKQYRANGSGKSGCFSHAMSLCSLVSLSTINSQLPTTDESQV